MRYLRPSKCLKATVKLTFTTRKVNDCSPWTACSVFKGKYFFLGKFGPKAQNYQFKLKFCTQANSNLQNSMVMFYFSVFDEKYLFGKIWFLKLKLSVSAEISYQTNLNMQTYVENMWCSLFCVLVQKKPFLEKPCQKTPKLLVKAEIWYQETNLNMRNSMMMKTFLVFDWKYLLAQFVPKIKIVSLS